MSETSERGEGSAPDLDGLRALLAKATPGPWRVGQWAGRCHKPSHGKSQHPGERGDDPCVYDYTLENGSDIVSTVHRTTVLQGCYDGYSLDVSDRALIVAAVNALPFLIERAEAGERAEENKAGLRAEVERLTAENNRLALERNAFERVAQASQWSNTTLGAQISALTAERDGLREALRKIGRLSDMHAEIMRDPERTGGWSGALSTALAFKRLGDDARSTIQGAGE